VTLRFRFLLAGCNGSGHYMIMESVVNQGLLDHLHAMIS
jgi:hypothetical protein